MSEELVLKNMLQPSCGQVADPMRRELETVQDNHYGPKEEQSCQKIVEDGKKQQVTTTEKVGSACSVPGWLSKRTILGI